VLIQHPPPQGSASTNIASQAVCANTARKLSRRPASAGDHRDDRTAPHVVAHRVRGVGQFRPSARSSWAGSVMTPWTPTAMAACRSAGPGSHRPTKTTRSRRGSARSAQRRAAASIDVVAQHRITSRRQDAFSRGHAPTPLAGYDAAPSGRQRLGMNPKLGTEKGDSVERKPRSATTDAPLTCPQCEKSPKKGRPPPGGEEAEVVVYQPRGVGLMHTRHKPSNPHYTHGTAGVCK
jgi:hypothetical protein